MTRKNHSQKVSARGNILHVRQGKWIQQRDNRLLLTNREQTMCTWLIPRYQYPGQQNDTDIDTDSDVTDYKLSSKL